MIVNISVSDFSILSISWFLMIFAAFLTKFFKHLVSFHSYITYDFVHNLDKTAGFYSLAFWNLLMSSSGSSL